jgi:hypothetical protein
MVGNNGHGQGLGEDLFSLVSMVVRVPEVGGESSHVITEVKFL